MKEEGKERQHPAQLRQIVAVASLVNEHAGSCSELGERLAYGKNSRATLAETFLRCVCDCWFISRLPPTGL